MIATTIIVVVLMGIVVCMIGWCAYRACWGAGLPPSREFFSIQVTTSYAVVKKVNGREITPVRLAKWDSNFMKFCPDYEKYERSGMLIRSDIVENQPTTNDTILDKIQLYTNYLYTHYYSCLPSSSDGDKNNAALQPVIQSFIHYVEGALDMPMSVVLAIYFPGLMKNQLSKSPPNKAKTITGKKTTTVVPLPWSVTNIINENTTIPDDPNSTNWNLLSLYAILRNAKVRDAEQTVRDDEAAATTTSPSVDGNYGNFMEELLRPSFTRPQKATSATVSCKCHQYATQVSHSSKQSPHARALARMSIEREIPANEESLYQTSAARGFSYYTICYRSPTWKAIVNRLMYRIEAFKCIYPSTARVLVNYTRDVFERTRRRNPASVESDVQTIERERERGDISAVEARRRIWLAKNDRSKTYGMGTAADARFDSRRANVDINSQLFSVPYVATVDGTDDYDHVAVFSDLVGPKPDDAEYAQQDFDACVMGAMLSNVFQCNWKYYPTRLETATTPPPTQLEEPPTQPINSHTIGQAVRARADSRREGQARWLQTMIDTYLDPRETTPFHSYVRIEFARSAQLIFSRRYYRSNSFDPPLDVAVVYGVGDPFQLQQAPLPALNVLMSYKNLFQSVGLTGDWPIGGSVRVQVARKSTSGVATLPWNCVLQGLDIVSLTPKVRCRLSLPTATKSNRSPLRMYAYDTPKQVEPTPSNVYMDPHQVMYTLTINDDEELTADPEGDPEGDPGGDPGGDPPDGNNAKRDVANLDVADLDEEDNDLLLEDEIAHDYDARRQHHRSLIRDRSRGPDNDARHTEPRNLFANDVEIVFAPLQLYSGRFKTKDGRAIDVDRSVCQQMQNPCETFCRDTYHDTHTHIPCSAGTHLNCPEDKSTRGIGPMLARRSDNLTEADVPSDETIPDVYTRCAYALNDLTSCKNALLVSLHTAPSNGQLPPPQYNTGVFSNDVQPWTLYASVRTIVTTFVLDPKQNNQDCFSRLQQILAMYDVVGVQSAALPPVVDTFGGDNDAAVVATLTPSTTVTEDVQNNIKSPTTAEPNAESSGAAAFTVTFQTGKQHAFIAPSTTLDFKPETLINPSKSMKEFQNELTSEQMKKQLDDTGNRVSTINELKETTYETVDRKATGRYVKCRFTTSGSEKKVDSMEVSPEGVTLLEWLDGDKVIETWKQLPPPPPVDGNEGNEGGGVSGTDGRTFDAFVNDDPENGNAHMNSRYTIDTSTFFNDYVTGNSMHAFQQYVVNAYNDSYLLNVPTVLTLTLRRKERGTDSGLTTYIRDLSSSNAFDTSLPFELREPFVPNTYATSSDQKSFYATLRNALRYSS